MTDALVDDFALMLTAEGKKPKTIKIYVKAAEWLRDAQGVTNWHAVTKATVRKHVLGIALRGRRRGGG